MIISEKRESRYQIIYPVNPTESLKFAALELKRYIAEISGAYIPQFEDSRHTEDCEIVIGYTNRGGYTKEDIEKLGDEGFEIKADSEKIFILGSGVRGALYGVYTFLEKICNCRFYTNDFERIPKADILDVKVTALREIPKYRYRNPYWYPQTTPEISAKLKINGCHGRKRFPDYLGGDVHYEGGFEHTIGFLAGQCPYGERAWVQPCLTNEETYNTVIKNVRWVLEQNPKAKLLSITQNDGDTGACKCEKCKAINDREESEMGTMLTFVNRVAEALEEEYPDVMFDTFAYRFTRKPPKTVRPRKNVIVRLCSIEQCFNHPLRECSETPGHDEPPERSFAQDLDEWAKIAPNLSIWNYTTNFTNFTNFFPNFDTLLANERFFAEHNPFGVFEQGNFASENGEFGALRGYLLARALWNPLMSEDEFNAYKKEFISDFYGDAGKYIEDYLALVDECKVGSHFGIYYDDLSLYCYVRGLESVHAGKREFLRRANELFDKAEAAAKDGRTLANVRRSRIHLIDYEYFVVGQEEQAAEEDKKAPLHELAISINKKKLEWMRRYDVNNNREFNCMLSVSEPDYEKHSLLW